MGMNAVSNIATKLWSMISIYIFIPLYIKILGETAYGLISFFATMQIAVNILGFGLANTLRREFAVGENCEENSIRKYKLFRDIELIYFVIGLSFFVVCLVGARTFVESWLNIEQLDTQMVAIVVSLMGASIALQMIANLYSGCLFGLEFQTLANSICIIWSVVKNLGSLLIIIFIDPNLILFYSWHILTDVLYLFVLRFSVLLKLNISSLIEWNFQDFKLMKSIYRYTMGILLISFIALINKQLDKIIISKYLTITEFGAYNVATTLGGLCTIIPTAIYTTVFPRFTNYATTRRKELLYKEFKTINKFVNLIISCTGAFAAVYSLDIIQIWTGSNSYVNILDNVSLFVALAVAITEYQEIPFALALAHGNTDYNVLIGTVFIPIVFVATYLGITNYGLVGAGFVYMMMMIFQTLAYEYLIYTKYIEKQAYKLIIRDTIFPFFISLCSAFFSKTLAECFFSSWLILLYGVFFCGITLVFLLMIFSRKELLVYFNNNIKREILK